MYVITVTVNDLRPYKVRCVIGCFEQASNFWLWANGQSNLHATAPRAEDEPVRTEAEKIMARELLLDWHMAKKIA